MDAALLVADGSLRLFAQNKDCRSRIMAGVTRISCGCIRATCTHAQTLIFDPVDLSIKLQFDPKQSYDFGLPAAELLTVLRENQWVELAEALLVAAKNRPWAFKSGEWAEMVKRIRDSVLIESSDLTVLTALNERQAKEGVKKVRADLKAQDGLKDGAASLLCKNHGYYSCIICNREDGGIGPITK
jgi:hypothetical protein